ncbi:TonB-dependent receptor plug domain-containing protein [Riemerella columbina]|uniref:TonB-dependent receptor plug domain-containing protein n=1 Tax=Riemerella columbina TaxID=103810 RepID=UPI00266EDC03|nr:TonB-dependent receptor [Riemerella columbina]WKS94663.1 TonB-dependent receptor [Riemerella columbina]
MKKPNATIAVVFLLPSLVWGQFKKDTIKEIEPVVISGNTFEQKASEVPIPIRIIDKKQIQQSGSRRLSQVLLEQTGLVITHNHGTGVQIQGMGAEYALILVNGMPLLGRMAGTLDLSRITVNDIQRIEVIKGPSSSLYGSDALAGVINIITQEPKTTQGSLSIKGETNTTLDISGNLSWVKNRLSAEFSANRYSSEGYGFQDDEYAKTVNPFETYTYATKWTYTFNPKWKMQVYGRWYNEKIDTKSRYQGEKITGTSNTVDYNIAPTLTWQPSEKVTSVLRLYHTGFQNNSELRFLSDQSLFDDTFYREHYHKAENFTELKWMPQLQTTFGAGVIWQDIAATRYDDTKHATQYYALAQASIKPMERWTVLAGFRWDSNSIFGSQFNPKLSTDFKFSKTITLRTSVGRGFKAPDFRQLYLNFTNSLVGYSVLGTQEVQTMMAKMQQQGLISQVLISPEHIADLKAESSWAWNFGGDVKPIKNLKINLNIFRNQIKNLINTAAIARKTNGQNVFSYRNLDRVFTQGIEAELSWQIAPYLNFSGGYQYLEAKDETVLEKIKNGTISSGENDAGVLIKLKPHHYFGIIGRSKHTFNAKIFYQDQNGWLANVRTIYRGRYGFADLDGNGIINNKKETAPGYVLMNTSVGKTWQRRYTVQVGVDNVLNYRDAYYNPEFYGRLWWLNFKIDL